MKQNYSPMALAASLMALNPLSQEAMGSAPRMGRDRSVPSTQTIRIRDKSQDRIDELADRRLRQRQRVGQDESYHNGRKKYTCAKLREIRKGSAK